MIIVNVNDISFFTTGKIATTTLVSIPGAESREIKNKSEYVPTVMNFVAGKQKVLLLREPEERFYAGLFQYLMIEHPLSFLNWKKEIGFSLFNTVFVPKLLNSTYWWNLIERYFDSVDWLYDEEMMTGQEKYHFGNWLTGLELDNSFDYLHFRNLSPFLDEKSIQHTRFNESKFMLGIDNVKLVLDIFEQMKIGISKTKHVNEDNVLDFIKSERLIYDKLMCKEYYAVQ